MNIAAMENTALDRKAIVLDLQRPLKFKFQLLQDLGDKPPVKDWLIKNVIALKETSSWIAPPGALKSALLGELAFAVARKRDWHDYKAKRTGSVVYFALERADLVKRRLRAYLARSGDQEAPPIAIVAATIDLMNPASVRDVIASIRAVEEATGELVVLVIFDTFAKLIAAGGGDEDKARDQGKVFANIQRIKDEIGAHVALVGHTGKDVERGSRGSNAILGHVDVEVTISGDGIKTATITKANDSAAGPLFSFKSEVHDFGPDPDGDPVTVNIISSEEVAASTPSYREPRLTANQKTMFAMLHDAGAGGLLTEDWNEKARQAGIGIKRRADLTDIRTALKSKGLIREMGGRWTVRH
jgi:hypothetical protein